ncbi:unnamed protein product, partial [Closterium sp. NIES-53]
VVTEFQEEFRRKELTAAAGEGGGSAYGMKGFKGRGSKKGKAKEGSGGEQYSGGKRSNKGGKRCDGKCWYCHVEGHPWINCHKLPDGWRPGQPSIEGSKGVHGAMGEGMGSEEGDGGAGGHGGMFYHVGEACSEDMVVPASKVALHRSSHWVIDTGAFMTMTNREDLLDEVRPSKAATVVLVTGQVVPMRGEGRVDRRLVGLKRVLLVPGLCADLLSTKALLEAGMKMEMLGTKVFKATLDGRVLWDLRGGKDMHRSMWEIPVLPCKEAATCLAAEAVRGGHASHVTSGGGGDGTDGGLLVHGGGALPSVTPSAAEEMIQGSGDAAEKRNEPPPSKIEALDGSNYEEWSGRMRSAFKRYKLLKLAMGEEKMPEEGDARDRWIEKSAVLYDLILESVNNDMFQHINELVELDDSGPKAWKLQCDVIQPNMLPMVIVLEKELAALSMRPGDDVKPVHYKIKDTYARMASAGSNVSQMQQCTKIISVLDNSWDNLIPTLNTQQDQCTLEWLRQQILQEDFRRRHTGGGGGRGRGRGRGFGRGRGRSDYNEGHGSSGGKGSTRMEGAFWYCKKAGHPWFKTKREVAAAVLKEWMPRAQRESGHKVKVIRTNNMGEFIGADFEAVLKKKGIQHQLTVALVKNRVLATVGDKQWVPYTKWYGSAPAVNILRAYGCMVVFHVPKEKRGKLEASGRWGVLLGLAKDHKGWLIWDLTSQQLTVSRDVKFLESLYYKEWKQQQQKLPTTPLIIEADEVQRPSRQVQVTVSDEEIFGVTEDGGEPEVEEQQQQQQQDAPPRAQRPIDLIG